MATEGGGVTLPGVGKVSKKWVWIVAAASAGSIGYFVIKRRSAAAAAAAVPAAAADSSDIDPLTGDIAGSAQDQADLAALQDEQYSTDDGDLGGDDLDGEGSLLPASGATGTTPPATNAEWAQEALAELGSLPGLSNALGEYLAGQPMSQTDQGLADQAIAVAGYPPVSGANGYPPAMNDQPTTGTGTGTGSVTSPVSGGTGAGSGTAPVKAGGPITVAPSGFHVVSVSGLSVTLGWNPLTPPAGQGPLRGYVVAYGQSATDLPYQQSAGPGANGTTITFNAGAGSAGLTHYFELWATPASSGGPHAGPISAKTT
jgi:hypothetical protein